MTLSSMFEPQDPAPMPPIPRTIKALIGVGCTAVTASVLLLEIYGNPEAGRPSAPTARLGVVAPVTILSPDDCTAAGHCNSGGPPCRN